MGWVLDVVQLFSPPVPTRFPSHQRFLLPDTRLYGASSPLAWLFRLYPLNFFTHFIYSLISITV